MLTVERVREIFSYDSLIGHLIWRPRPREYFSSDNAFRTWNGKHAGKIAGSMSGGKYRRVNFEGKYYKEHRLIWFYIYGRWPEYQIDHISGEHDGNRLENLREATNAENSRNRPRRSDNKSGHVGVIWMKRNQKWAAVIGRDGKQKHIGLFIEFDDAVAARKAAEREHGFHPNHGRAL